MVAPSEDKGNGFLYEPPPPIKTGSGHRITRGHDEPDRRSKTGRFHEHLIGPSHRSLHIRKTFDLFNICLARKDAMRSLRALRVLLYSHEWRPEDLWRYALEVATMWGNNNDSAQTRITRQQEAESARRRLAFLRSVSARRGGIVRGT